MQKQERKFLTARKKCVCEDRNGQYGEPEDNFKNIAAYWEVYLRNNCVIQGTDVCVRPADVAMMMALFKIARIETACMPSEDSYVDAAGYIACAGGIELGR